MLKRSRSILNLTDLDLLAGIRKTISELEEKDGIPSRAKIFKTAKQDLLKTSRLIYRWLLDRLEIFNLMRMSKLLMRIDVTAPKRVP